MNKLLMVIFFHSLCCVDEFRRHLCEFIGLDIEMALKENYVEVLRGSVTLTE